MSNKDKIVLAAIELFSQNGFTETSISRIAKKAQVSKGLTYTHFKNKDELLEVCISKTIGEMTAVMLAQSVPCIGLILKSFFTNLKDNAKLIRLCILLVIHPQTPAQVVTLLAGQKVELLELFSQLLEDKFKENAAREAEILLAILDGVAMEFATSEDPEYLQNMEDYLTLKYTF